MIAAFLLLLSLPILALANRVKIWYNIHSSCAVVWALMSVCSHCKCEGLKSAMCAQFEDDVYIATSEPHGNIEATITRGDIEPHCKL